ncbi:uncharacterized protein A1O9_05662 [Exophiala aquamarina CBS 119918]|uniref:Uncharacterized protein n=1 Tax=Exophiala aquamarina CBS 119918 TaxID=1182545 RepID=A0A072PD99_9EURO|nr:uncharacterized protein A1O9_05662 [Exophiala aquamarina CBS 119918]KEF57742.1 hypothetical protein A1O9_05662 [Exophiala aquamarina CBS 119918]
MKWAKGLFHDRQDVVEYRSVPGVDHGDEFDGDQATLSRPSNSPSWQSWRCLVRLSVTARVSIFLSFVLVASLLYVTPAHRVALSTSDSTSSSSFFHLLIPATSSGAGLCKNIFSAAALDYPTPRLINWKMHYSGGDRFGGLHIAKITGTLDYLKSLGPESDQELVLMVDGFDMWFQLPPIVLLDRYQRIINRHNDRIRRRLGRAMDREGVKQTIIMAAQNMCWPQDNSEPICYVVPDSELAHDVYGNVTDTDSRHARARWLNSGFMMGPVADVYKLLKAVHNVALQNPSRGSDQASFNDVFGQQEYYRELVRERHLATLQRLIARVNRVFGLEDERSKMVLSANSTLFPTSDTANSDDYEFHLGPDYLGELTMTIDGRPEDLAWHSHSKPEDAARWSIEKGIPPPVRVTNLPDDIARAVPPFSIPKAWKSAKHNNSTQTDDDNDDERTREEATLAQRSWSSVPLYTHLYTGVVPSTIHFNLPKHNMNTDWDKMWMFPRLREQLSARVLAPRAPVAVMPEQKGIRRQRWWSSIDSKGGMMAENASTPLWLSWETLCNSDEIENEVFRDKKGPWVDPRSAKP